MVTVSSLTHIEHTVKLGGDIRSSEDYFEHVRGFNQYRANVRKIAISGNAKDVLLRPGFYFTSQPFTAGLVKVTLKQLGLRGKHPREEIYRRARLRGLTMCRAEIGPLLRAQYLDQPSNERLAIGMEPIKSPAFDNPSKAKAGVFQDLFVVDGEEKALWLRAVSGSPNALWDEEFAWIFQAW